jgi:hypothetical protein
MCRRLAGNEPLNIARINYISCEFCYELFVKHKDYYLKVCKQDLSCSLSPYVLKLVHAAHSSMTGVLGLIFSEWLIRYCCVCCGVI